MKTPNQNLTQVLEIEDHLKEIQRLRRHNLTKLWVHQNQISTIPQELQTILKELVLPLQDLNSQQISFHQQQN